ncbi:ABC transporter permease [Streptomyces sp. NPDC048590]|uniref:ABC transporter permease n=1 Tax=Streptomyces sp. NPDC048590 TaxID=3365574 RepID=UPI00371D0610
MTADPPTRRRTAPGLIAGFEFQIVAMRGQADTYFSLITAPFFAVVFMAIMEYTGRTDLNSHAVVAPMLITLWTAALSFSGEMISDDRANGRLESLVAAPVEFSLLIFGRLSACMLLALPSFLMSYLAAGTVFGYWMSFERPVLFAVALVLTAAATAATATALSAVFVLAPGARIVQNTLSFPVYLLGGVMVPVSYFPDWLEPVARVVYLSWGADLLRAATTPGEGQGSTARHLVMLCLLGTGAFVLGRLFIARFLRRARALGALAKDGD